MAHAAAGRRWAHPSDAPAPWHNSRILGESLVQTWPFLGVRHFNSETVVLVTRNGSAQETYEEYFKAVSEQAVEEVLASPRDEDEDDAFRIPRLGQRWSETKSVADDYLSEGMDDDEPLVQHHNSRAQGRRRGGLASFPSIFSCFAPPACTWAYSIPRHLMLIVSSGELADNSGAGAPPQAQTAEQRLKTQKMTMRMLASFIHQDGIPGVPV